MGESLVRGEKIGFLRSCIEGLPIDFREVLIMRVLEEMSYQEIADVTGLPLGTVMSRLSRARKRLEDCAGNRATLYRAPGGCLGPQRSKAAVSAEKPVESKLLVSGSRWGADFW